MIGCNQTGMQSKKNSIVIPSVVSIITVIIAVCISELAIRNLGRIIGIFVETQFSSIFGQLEHAVIRPSTVVTVVCIIASFLIFRKISGNKAGRVIVASIIILLVFIPVLIIFSRVNDIVFLDVITSLVRYLRNGLAEAL